MDDATADVASELRAGIKLLEATIAELTESQKAGDVIMDLRVGQPDGTRRTSLLPAGKSASAERSTQAIQAAIDDWQAMLDGLKAQLAAL